MQLHNKPEATPLYEHNERIGYMATSQDYEVYFNQEFQQQTYHSLYSPTFHRQQSFVGTPSFSDSYFAAILSYLFGWLTGLLFTLFGGRDRFIRFHALQSLVFFGTINLIDFGLFTIMRGQWHHNHLVLFGCVISFLLLNFIAFVSWIVAMVQAARGEYFKLPSVGEWVAHHFNLYATPLW